MQYGWNPKILNPWINQAGIVSAVTDQVYEKLITYDHKSEISYRLATSYEYSPDHKTITFQLRKGVKWHDGVPFTSADVKWCYDNIILKIPSTTRTQFAGFGKVTCRAPDNYTVVFTAEMPWLDYVFAFSGSILPKHIYDGAPEKNWDDNPANMKPIGTGPWKIQEFVVGDHITFAANEDYYRGRVYIDKMIWKIIPSAQSALLAFEAKEVDLIWGWTGKDLPHDIPRLGKTTGVRIYAWNYWAINKLLFNFRDEAVAKSPWLKDVRVRRAMAHAMNMSVIVERGVGSWAEVQPSLYPKPPYAVSWAYNPDVPRYPYDLKKAEQLLDDAGYRKGPDGVRIRTECIFSETYVPVDVVEMVKDMFRNIGIEVTMTAYDANTYSSRFWNNPEGYHDVPMSLFLQAVGPHPDMLTRIYHSTATIDKGGWNLIWYKNPEVDRLLDAARVETDQAKQTEMYKRMQYILMEDLPNIPMYLVPQVEIWNADFDRDADSMTPLWGQNPFYQVWWLKAQPPTKTLATTTTAITRSTTTQPDFMTQYGALFGVAVPAVVILVAVAVYLTKKRRHS